MGVSAYKCVHLASSNPPCGLVSLQAKLRGGVSLCRSSSLNPVNITIEICKNILNA